MTSPPKPLAVPVRVSALAAVEEEELPPQAARVAAHSAPHRAMERMRFICLNLAFVVPCRPACPGGLGARRKALCKPISKKTRTCACSGEGLAHFDVRTHLSDNKSHYYNIKTQR